MGRHAGQRFGPRVGCCPGRGPRGFGSSLARRHRCQRFVGGLDLRQRCIRGLEFRELGLCSRLVGRQRRGDVLQLGAQIVGLLLEDGDDLLLLRIAVELLLALGDLGQLIAVDGLRDRNAGLLDRKPHHRDHIGHDQNDVLRHLGPGDRAHPAGERTDQDAAQADKDPDLEGKAGQACGDQADPVNLRHHVGERTQDRADDADEARQISFIAGAEKIGDRKLPELAHVRRQKQGHQAIAAGPAHDECQAPVSRQVYRAGHPDERCSAHPVGPGSHAVVEGRHAPAGHVVLGGVCGAGHDADTGIQAYRGEQEDKTDPALGQAHLLEHREH